ncbi:MAG: hypothetical protein Q7T50_07815 [Candidatus Magasanikbacteria bacterium]|nr:hypothetical protein [Candidatus Magasanikbacteria bacterium]
MRKITSLIMLALIFIPVFALTLTANAGSVDNMLWGGYQTNIQTASGLGNTDPREIAGSVVNIFLGFLGVIAVLIILYGGFKWMTAGGDEGPIGEAKQMISAGVVGLVVILAAFGIAQFVINALYNATGATGG